MTCKTLFASVGLAALLSATALVSPGMAAPADPGAGYHSGFGGHGGHGATAADDQGEREWRGGNWGDRDNRGSFQDRDYGGGFSDGDFGERGRFYYGGDVRERLDRLAHFVRYLTRTHQIGFWQAHRLYDTLGSIKAQAFFFQRDGRLSWQEKRVLNARIDMAIVMIGQGTHGHGWSFNR